MKIIFIHNMYPPNIIGGAEISVNNLAEKLQKAGNSVAVITLSPENKSNQRKLNGVDIYELPYCNDYWQFHNLKQSPLSRVRWHIKDRNNAAIGAHVAHILDEIRPDVVSTHNLQGLSTSVWKEIKSRGIKLVHMLHDYYLMCPKSTMYKLDNCERICLGCSWFTKERRSAAKAVDGVVGISKDILSRHQESGFFSEKKHIVIYNSRRVSSDRKKRKLPAGGQSIRVGFLGAMERSKGIEVFLEAMEKLRGENLVGVVGGRSRIGTYEDELKARFKGSQISFLGRVRSEDFFETIDILVVPSLWREPLGMVVVEAMQHGVPVIGSAIGGIPETIDLTGGGLLTEPGNVMELVAAIKKILSDPELYQTLSENALSARDIYTQENQAQRYAKFLSTI